MFFRFALFLGFLMITAEAQAGSDKNETTHTIAHAFLQRLFVKHDAIGAYSAYAVPDFIEHNPMLADGVADRQTYLAMLATKLQRRSPNEAHVVNMILVDNDLFAAHHHVFRSPEDRGRVFVDIWRVANGRIVEHWNITQPIPESMAHANGMACGRSGDHASARSLGETFSHPTCGLPDPRASRDTTMRVFRSYLAELGTGGVRAAVESWFASNYRQHAPTIGDGAEPAIEFLERQFAGTAATPRRASPTQVLAEGDYALLHRLVTDPVSNRRTANIDIFRVTNGKISEHWDLQQPVPDMSANKNDM